MGGTNFSRKQLGSYADEVVVRPINAQVACKHDFDRARVCLRRGHAWISCSRHTKIGPGDRGSCSARRVARLIDRLTKKLGAKAVGVCSVATWRR